MFKVNMNNYFSVRPVTEKISIYQYDKEGIGFMCLRKC